MDGKEGLPYAPGFVRKNVFDEPMEDVGKAEARADASISEMQEWRRFFTSGWRYNKMRERAVAATASPNGGDT